MTAIPTTTREYRLPKYEGIDSLSLGSSPLAFPKEHEVLVKIHAVALNYRDILISKGTYPWTLKDNVVPCSDMAGEVVALGGGVTEWKVGDRVTSEFSLTRVHGETTLDNFNFGLGAPIDGVLSEYRHFPEQALVAIPDLLSYEEASTLTCAGITAYNAFFGTERLKAGDSVLIQGTGGVSVLGLQMAVASGVEVIITSSSDEKLQIAKKLGAKHTINYKQTPSWDQEVLKLTNGRGVDYVLEVGGEGTLVKSLSSLKIGGHILIIGFLAGSGDITNLPSQIIMKAANIRGLAIGNRGHLEDLMRLISATKMIPYVDRVFRFEEVKEAFAHLEKQAHVGKVVIKITAN